MYSEETLAIKRPISQPALWSQLTMHVRVTLFESLCRAYMHAQSANS